MEALNSPALPASLPAPSASAPPAPPGYPQASSPLATRDRAVREAELALESSLAVTKMLAAALLVSAGVAAQWAVPEFALLPTALAAACLAGAAAVSAVGRALHRSAWMRCAAKLGLSEDEARRRLDAGEASTAHRTQG